MVNGFACGLPDDHVSLIKNAEFAPSEKRFDMLHLAQVGEWACSTREVPLVVD